jgi:hypothetical protein
MKEVHMVRITLDIIQDITTVLDIRMEIIMDIVRTTPTLI